MLRALRGKMLSGVPVAGNADFLALRPDRDRCGARDVPVLDSAGSRTAHRARILGRARRHRLAPARLRAAASGAPTPSVSYAPPPETEPPRDLLTSAVARLWLDGAHQSSLLGPDEHPTPPGGPVAVWLDRSGQETRISDGPRRAADHTRARRPIGGGFRRHAMAHSTRRGDRPARLRVPSTWSRSRKTHSPTSAAFVIFWSRAWGNRTRHASSPRAARTRWLTWRPSERSPSRTPRWAGRCSSRPSSRPRSPTRVSLCV